MTKDKLIETLKMAQDALHMATLPFPIDEVKTRRALEAVDKVHLRTKKVLEDKMDRLMGVMGAREAMFCWSLTTL